MPFDPKEFADPIKRAIFLEEDHRLHDSIREMVNRNSEAGGSPNAFICDGLIVTNLSGMALKNLFPLPVADELHDEAYDLVRHIKKRDTDKRKFDQYFLSVSRRCRDLQDVRDLVPDMIASKVPALAGIGRSPNFENIASRDPMVRIPYRGLQDIISYYLANRIIF